MLTKQASGKIMDIPFPRTPENTRPIGRLLEEISWVGGNCTKLRKAERCKENMLTTEVFQALDLLPRDDFLCSVIKDASGDANGARKVFCENPDNLRITVLPGSVFLKPSGNVYTKSIPVQTDVLIESDEIYCFVEAKALAGKPSFQQEQLARQFAAVHFYATGRVPMMLLVLPNPPPVRIAKSGTKDVYEAITDELLGVIKKSDVSDDMYPELSTLVSDTVIWTTWDRISEITRNQTKRINHEVGVKSTIFSSISRIADHIIGATEWHR